MSWTGFDPSGFIAQICELPVRFDSNAMLPDSEPPLPTVTQFENSEVSSVTASVTVTVTPSPGVRPESGISKVPAPVSTKLT